MLLRVFDVFIPLCRYGGYLQAFALTARLGASLIIQFSISES